MLLVILILALLTVLVATEPAVAGDHDSPAERGRRLVPHDNHHAVTDIQYPGVTSRPEWLEVRLALLAREQQMTRERDRLNTARRELSMVRLDRPYILVLSNHCSALIHYTLTKFKL